MFSCALGKTSRKRMKHLLNVYLIYTFYLPHVLSLTFFVSLHYGSEVKVLVAQSCPTLCDPMDCSLPDSSVHWIIQARKLEWLPCPPPGDLPNPGIEPGSPALQANSLPPDPSGKPLDPTGPAILIPKAHQINRITKAKKYQVLLIFCSR